MSEEVLTDIERRSAAWLKLKVHYEQRLENFRKANDGNLSPEHTQKLRGQIAECKALLALGEPQQKIAVEPHID